MSAARPGFRQPAHSSRRLRQVRASLRDTWLLLREFGWPLLMFTVAVGGGGALYHLLSQASPEPVSNLAEAIYQVLALTFLQSVGDFPSTWYLELFYFIMPIIGLIIVAQGVTDFGILLFNRRARGKEWEMAVASTFSNHIVLIGLGHLGFRVVRDLYEMDLEVVVVEKNPAADTVASVKRMGIPVLQDDATRMVTLESAGVPRASAILLCTQNDSLNLQIALKARRLNPNIQVVIRIFDDDFAAALHEQFGFTAFSATGMAAPAFAAAAAGADMTRPITIEGETLTLARVKISEASTLCAHTMGSLEKKYNLSVVLLRRNHESDLHPPAETQILPGDTLGILGGLPEIGLIMADNHGRPERPARH